MRRNIISSAGPTLLSVVELGGYPDFASLYKKHGFDVVVASSVRRALAVFKKQSPGVVVAEFNFQSDFRDRTSSLESLLAVTQRMPDTKVIIFYEREYRHQLERLTDRFAIFDTLAFPIQEAELEECLKRTAGVG